MCTYMYVYVCVKHLGTWSKDSNNTGVFTLTHSVYVVEATEPN